MFSNSSKPMRLLVYLAGTLFLLGIVCQMLLNLFAPGPAWISEYLPHLSFCLFLGCPVLLLLSVLLALLPGKAKRGKAQDVESAA